MIVGGYGVWEKGGVGMMVKTRRSPGLGRGKQSRRVSDTDIRPFKCITMSETKLDDKRCRYFLVNFHYNRFESAPFEDSALWLE